MTAPDLHQSSRPPRSSGEHRPVDQHSSLDEHRTGDTGLAYHRLTHLLPEWSRWWRGLTTLLAALLVFLILSGLLVTLTVVVLALLPGVNVGLGESLGDPASPLGVFMALGMAALAAPSAWLGVRLGGWRDPRLLWSVTGLVRWELLRSRGALIVLCPPALLAVLSALVVDPGRPTAGAGAVVLSMLFALVLSPLAVIGLELAFRGLAQQMVGTWIGGRLAGPLAAIALPVPFALLAQATPTTGVLLTAIVLAIATGALTWKTGGLELPILLHAGALIPTVVLAPLSGPALPGDGLLSAITMPLVILGAAAGAWWWISRRDGLALGQPVVRPATARPVRRIDAWI
ncbi:MAG: CPBP family intramembrane metalloprotease [Micrococcus sp.]|nr:CPBP family intramembrane metalloprotease [Micrococcus sp.]